MGTPTSPRDSMEMNALQSVSHSSCSSSCDTTSHGTNIEASEPPITASTSIKLVLQKLRPMLTSSLWRRVEITMKTCFEEHRQRLLAEATRQDGVISAAELLSKRQFVSFQFQTAIRDFLPSEALEKALLEASLTAKSKIHKPSIQAPVTSHSEGSERDIGTVKLQRPKRIRSVDDSRSFTELPAPKRRMFVADLLFNDPQSCEQPLWIGH